MSRSVLLFSVVVLLLLPIPVTADEKVVQIYGLGMSSCASLIQAVRQDSPNVALNHKGRQFPTQAHAYQQWLAGFVSSYNMYSPETGKLGSDTDIDGMMGWIHSYCQRNPTTTVVQAAAQMVRSPEGKSAK